MREIPVGKGRIAFVDDDVFDAIGHYSWTANRLGQVGRTVSDKSTPCGQTSILLSRIVMDAKPGQVVDHINRDPMDNRRDNLRLCSMHDNQGNRGKQRKRATSIYKGVYKHNLADRWIAQITSNYKVRYLGCFKTAEDAAKAYDTAAIEVFGEYALTNFPRKENK